MTPQLIEALGAFVVFPICGAAVAWKILDSFNQSATYEDLYRRIAVEAGRREVSRWKSKGKETEAKP